MAKKSITLNDFSGGINKSTSERDIEGNEVVQAQNVSLHRPGLVLLSSSSIESEENTASPDIDIQQGCVFPSNFN